MKDCRPTEKVGADGVLSIENGNGLETVVEIEEGMEIDRGYGSPQFVTNNEKLLVEMENARIIITDEKIEQVKDLVPLLEQINEAGSPPVLLIAGRCRRRSIGDVGCQQT